ncbi:MAG: hypothetical protein ACYDCT_08595 [Dehalococcoidia bacterium]
MSVLDVIFRCTEIFELAARFAVTAAGDEGMHFDIQLKRVAGRELALRDVMRAPFLFPRAATVDDVPYSVDVSRADLLAEPRDLAIRAAQKVFELFTWDASVDSLRGLQGELWR